MDLSQLFHLARNDSISDFIPLAQIKTSNDKEAYRETDYMMIYTLDEFKNEFPTLDATKIFYCNGIHKIYYFDREKYILFNLPLYGRDISIRSKYSVEKQINIAIKDFTSSLQNHEYSMPIMAVSDRMRMEYFNILLEDDKIEGLFDYFIEAYTLSDFGCEAISYENMIKLLDSRSIEEKNKMRKKITKALKKYPENLTVYRGEASMSTPHHISWSWTLDINVANFFATRFGYDDNKIIKGIVNKDCIECYFDNEQECIVNPKNVEDIEVVELYGHNWLKSRATPYFLSLYHKYRDIHVEKYKKNHTTELHSPLHSVRVLCLALLLGILYRLNHTDLVNLATAIIYHDLGRIDDSVDDLHGKRGAEIFLKNKISSKIDREIVSFLIEYHCLDDNIGNEYIEKNFDNSERARLLFNIIKDADALDRIRLGKDGLDISYLRLNESKKMTLIARLFITEIKIE